MVRHAVGNIGQNAYRNARCVEFLERRQGIFVRRDFLMEMGEPAFDRILDAHQHAPLVNIGSGIEVSIAELAALVGRVVGYQGAIVYVSTKPDGTPRKLLDTGRLQQLGWRQKTDLERGLTLAYHDFVGSVA